MNEEVRAIMERERADTLARIENLSLSRVAKDDAIRVCVAVQTALNEMVAELDRPIDARVPPTALRLMADEHERMMAAFVAAGLAAGVS